MNYIGGASPVETERPNPMPRRRFHSLAPAVAVAVAAIIAPAARAETSLRAVSALPRSVDPTRSFLDNLIHPSNRANKGTVRIEYLGGPNVAPSRKALSALGRGRVDVMRGPAHSWSAAVRGGDALALSR